MNSTTETSIFLRHFLDHPSLKDFTGNFDDSLDQLYLNDNIKTKYVYGLKSQLKDH